MYDKQFAKIAKNGNPSDHDLQNVQNLDTKREREYHERRGTFYPGTG